MCISQLRLNPILTCGISSECLWVSFKDNGDDLFLISCRPYSMSYPLGLRTVFEFGPFKGKTVEYSLNRDYQYVLKCLQDIQGFSLTTKAEFMLLEKQAEDEYNTCLS